MARRRKARETRAPGPPVEEVGVPAERPVPALVALLLIAGTLAGCGYFVAKGFSGVAAGKVELAGELLAIEERDQAPHAFELEQLEGGKLALEGLRGKIVLINFWATWCPPCIEEMPSMVRLYEKLKDEPRFVMLAISTDESWEPVKRFFDGSNPGFTVLLDPKGQLAKKYGSTMFPETYVLVDGKVRAFVEGPRKWDSWYAESYLRGLVSQSAQGMTAAQRPGSSAPMWASTAR